MTKKLAMVLVTTALLVPTFGWAEENNAVNQNEELLLATYALAGNWSALVATVAEEDVEQEGLNLKPGKVPIPFADGLQFSFSGYAQERYDSSSGDLTNDRTRLKFSLVNGSSCGFHAELDLSGAQRSSQDLRDSNWIQKAWASCVVNESTTADFGRIATENTFGTLWPGGIITARYPGMYPWEGYYAYGTSLKKGMGSWTYSGTISGRSDLQFDESGQFDRVELVGRAVRSFGDSGQYGLTVQTSEDFMHGGMDFKVTRGNTRLDGGVFLSNADNSPFSGFVQVEQLLTERFAVHLLAEEQTDGDEVLTSGVGIRWRGFYLVGDYEMNFSSDEDSLLTGLRYNWNW